MPDEKFDYHRYLASREWALLREQVRKRSGGWCERCLGDDFEGPRPMAATHHVTYERTGQERLEDLLGLCAGCHAFISGKGDNDPLEVDVTTRRTAVMRCLEQYHHERSGAYGDEVAIVLAVAVEQLVDAIAWSELVRRGLPVDHQAFLRLHVQFNVVAEDG